MHLPHVQMPLALGVSLHELSFQAFPPGMRGVSPWHEVEDEVMFLGVHRGQDSHHLAPKVAPWGWPIVLMGAKVFCGFRS